MSIVQINVLTVPDGQGAELEKRFANRARAVDGVDGFEGFDLLRPTTGFDRYMVITRWASQEAFEAWVASRAFQHGHGGKPTEDGKPTSEAKQAHAGERQEGHAKPAATDSELWGFDVVDLDGLLAEG